jgi:TPP-dependent 2-oxoacid decarboxylase
VGDTVYRNVEMADILAQLSGRMTKGRQRPAQEIGQFGRRGLRPIVFVLNNSGYVSERM